MRLIYCEKFGKYAHYLKCNLVQKDCKYRSEKIWNNYTELNKDKEKPSDYNGYPMKPNICIIPIRRKKKNVTK